MKRNKPKKHRNRFKPRNELHETKMTQNAWISGFCCRGCIDRTRHSDLQHMKKSLRDHRTGNMEERKNIWHRPNKGQPWKIN